jgi:hypothetical protein
MTKMARIASTIALDQRTKVIKVLQLTVRFSISTNIESSEFRIHRQTSITIDYHSTVTMKFFTPTSTLAFVLFGVTVSAASIPKGGSTTTVPSGVESKTTADNLQLIESLLTAATAVDRLALLNNNSDWVYDFNSSTASNVTTKGDGGRTVKADRKAFPALTGTGVSMTLGFLGPCGFNTPHTHPRSAEINVVVQGALVAEMVPENGAQVVRNRLDPFQMTVFPQGAVHTEYNPTCGEAIFVAGFASEDPGVQQVAQTLFELDDDLISAVFDKGSRTSADDIDKMRAQLPPNVALGVTSCLKTCGLNVSDIL